MQPSLRDHSSSVFLAVYFESSVWYHSYDIKLQGGLHHDVCGLSFSALQILKIGTGAWYPYFTVSQVIQDSIHTGLGMRPAVCGIINLVTVGRPTPSVATVSGKNFTAVSQSWHLVRSSDASSERRDMILCIYFPM